MAAEKTAMLTGRFMFDLLTGEGTASEAAERAARRLVQNAQGGQATPTANGQRGAVMARHEAPGISENQKPCIDTSGETIK